MFAVWDVAFPAKTMNARIIIRFLIRIHFLIVHSNQELDFEAQRVEMIIEWLNMNGKNHEVVTFLCHTFRIFAPFHVKLLKSYHTFRIIITTLNSHYL
jgi:hypothetical protein